VLKNIILVSAILEFYIWCRFRPYHRMSCHVDF